MSDEITLRDTFAAAALTGLLAQGDDADFPENTYWAAAYRMADAMLRERHTAVRDNCVTSNQRRMEYPQPTLTDEEREAVKWCRDNIIPMSSSASSFAFIHTATLRKLLERLA